MFPILRTKGVKASFASPNFDQVFNSLTSEDLLPAWEVLLRPEFRNRMELVFLSGLCPEAKAIFNSNAAPTLSRILALPAAEGPVGAYTSWCVPRHAGDDVIIYVGSGSVVSMFNNEGVLQHAGGIDEDAQGHRRVEPASLDSDPPSKRPRVSLYSKLASCAGVTTSSVARYTTSREPTRPRCKNMTWGQLVALTVATPPTRHGCKPRTLSSTLLKERSTWSSAWT